MIKNAFITDLNRSLKSWGFAVGVIGMAVSVFLGALEQLLPVFQGQYVVTEGFTVQLMFTALSSDIVLLLVPILCAIPFTTAFLDDYKSRFIRKYLPRVGRRTYVSAKVVTTAISGGLALSSGVILAFSILLLLFIPMEVPEEKTEILGYEVQVADKDVDIQPQQNLVEFMKRSFLFFLSGCFWSLIGGVFATLTMSKYAAYASPFILYYVLVILCNRYFKGIYIINPQEWLKSDTDWVGGIWGINFFVIELIIVIGFVYCNLIERKLNDV